MKANIIRPILDNHVIRSRQAEFDVQSVGYMMLELMEPATSILWPKTIVLKNPERWENQEIKDFLSATRNLTLTELQEVVFLYNPEKS